MQLKRISAITLRVSNMARAVAFYGNILSSFPKYCSRMLRGKCGVLFAGTFATRRIPCHRPKWRIFTNTVGNTCSKKAAQELDRIEAHDLDGVVVWDHLTSVLHAGGHTDRKNCVEAQDRPRGKYLKNETLSYIDNPRW
jgi:hypothetical protein